MSRLRASTGLLVAGALLWGGGDQPEAPASYACAEVQSVQGDPLQVVPGTIGDLVCQTMVDIDDFWIARGFQERANVPVVYLEDEDEYICPHGPMDIRFTNSPDSKFYCPEKKEIGVSEQGLVVADSPQSRWQAARIMFILGHETGHDHQEPPGILEYYEWGVELKQRIELQADCLSGQIMAELSPELLAEMDNVATQFTSPEIHGSPDQRLAAFYHGATEGGCSFANLETQGLIPQHPDWLLPLADELHAYE